MDESTKMELKKNNNTENPDLEKASSIIRLELTQNIKQSEEGKENLCLFFNKRVRS